MVIFFSVISIFIIATIAWFIGKLTPIKICPICAGVAGTWLWFLGGIFAGFLPIAIYQLPTAILMGGSVVGIAYQIEKKIPSQKSSILFKVLFIPTGFVVMYSLLLSRWIVFVPAFLLLVILSAVFAKSSKETIETSNNIEEIKKNMENCC